MTDDGKTSTEKSGHHVSSVWSTIPREMLVSKLESAIRGETILFPIQVQSEMEYANLAKVLTLSSNVGIPRTYVSFRLPQSKSIPLYQERINIMLKLKDICAPLSARCSVVSLRPKRLLTCVSFSRPTIALENTPLDGG